MKKAVAIPYIIALIIGVIVVAVLAYWFISSGGKGIDIGKEAECTARKTEYCASQTADVWNKMVEKCGDNKFKIVPDSKNPGKSIHQCYSFCSTIIPGWKNLPTNTNPECTKPT